MKSPWVLRICDSCNLISFRIKFIPLKYFNEAQQWWSWQLNSNNWIMTQSFKNMMIMSWSNLQQEINKKHKKKSLCSMGEKNKRRFLHVYLILTWHRSSTRVCCWLVTTWRGQQTSDLVIHHSVTVCGFTVKVHIGQLITSYTGVKEQKFGGKK